MTEVPHTITEIIDWQGLSLSVTFDPDWLCMGNVAHLEIKTIKPACAANPISETGYRSHFLPLNEIRGADGVRSYVLTWLDQASACSDWHFKNQQLSLFRPNST